MNYEKVFYGHLNDYDRMIEKDHELIKYLPKEFIEQDLVRMIDLQDDIYIGYVIVVYSENNIDIIFYLYSSDQAYELNEKPEIMFHIAHNMSLGNIHFHIDNEDKDLTILNIEIDPTIRGKNLAKYLIIFSLLYVNIVSPDIKIVKLDDMSDNAVLTNEEDLIKKNLYRQLGLEYIRTGQPEMHGDIYRILEVELGRITRERSRKRMKYTPKSGIKKKKKKNMKKRKTKRSSKKKKGKTKKEKKK